MKKPRFCVDAIVCNYVSTFNTCNVVSSGISLTEEQWSALRKNVSAIDTAVKKMQSRIM